MFVVLLLLQATRHGKARLHGAHVPLAEEAGHRVCAVAADRAPSREGLHEDGGRREATRQVRWPRCRVSAKPPSVLMAAVARLCFDWLDLTVSNTLHTLGGRHEDTAKLSHVSVTAIA